MARPRTLCNAIVVALSLLGLTALPVSAQDSCEDALLWTRGLAVRIGQSRAQAERDVARAQARQQRLEVEVQQLREEISRLRSAEPKNKGVSP